MDFYDKVYIICKRIPAGKVASYGQIALLAGKPKAPRQVGRALNLCPEEITVPAHRVVNRDGVLSGAGAFFFAGAQKQLLEGEGVEVSGDNKVDMGKFRWQPEKAELEEIYRIISKE